MTIAKLSNRRIKRAARKPPPAGAAWKILSEKKLFETPDARLSVFVQKVRLPDGRVVDDYYQVKFPEAAVIVARTKAGKIIFLKQYLHGFRQSGTVLPAGQVAPGEPPRRAAERELLEETGYASRRWTSMGSIVPHTNQGCGRVYFFFADGAEPVARPCSGDLEVARVIFMRPDEILAALRGGRAKMSMGTITALTLSAVTGRICPDRESRICSK